MKELSEKERLCLLQYVKDLISVVLEENNTKISDGINTYNLQELETLRKKLSNES